MGIRRGEITSKIVSDGLVFNMDAANRASTIPVSTIETSFNTVNLSQSGSFSDNGIFDSSTITPSFAFGGTDDYIQTNHSVNGSNAITVSCWFNLNTVSKNWHSVVDAYYTSGDRNFQMWVHNNAKLYIYHLGTAHSGAGSLSADTWYNATFTYTGTSNGILYLNGSVLDASVPNSGNAGSDINLRLGARVDGHASSYTNGNIGSIHIYNRALSAEEVLSNYNGLKERFGL
jgi:hypothetical protein